MEEALTRLPSRLVRSGWDRGWKAEVDAFGPRGKHVPDRTPSVTATRTAN